ncbi:MAG: tetratricopeptide repeat protein [Hyphomicrobiales bacterium]
MILRLAAIALTIMVLLPLNQAKADCVTDPTYSCLLESSLKLTHEAQRVIADKVVDEIEKSVVSGNIQSILREIASIQAMAGDFDAAAVTAAGLGAEQLSYFVQENLTKYPPGDADLSPIHNAAQAILESTAKLETNSKTLKAQAAAILVLVGVRATNNAQSALNDALHRFGQAVTAGNTEILVADGRLMDAALALNDLAAARKIIGIISREGMDKRGFSKEWPGWTNEIEIAAFGRALAQTGDIAGAEKIAQSLTGGLRHTVLEEIAKHRIKSANVSETIEWVRGLPMGNSAESRDPAIWLLTEQLIERKQLTEAAALADEMLDVRWRDNIRVGIALAYLSTGDVTSAESLLAKITDSGGAAVLIKIAQIAAKRGEAAKARQLLDDAHRALAVEKDPARLVDWNVNIALTLIELHDSDGAATAAKAALQIIDGIEDPSLQAEEASYLAAVQLKLDRPEDAVATLERGGWSELERAGMGAPFGLLMSAGFLADKGYSGDAKACVSLALKKLPPVESIEGLYLAMFYAEAAKVLVTASREN